MSIRWLRNVVIDDEKGTIEIQVGDRKIGDKCYTRINTDVEVWFENKSETRAGILSQGIDILKKRLAGKNLTYPDGKTYAWD